MPGVEHCATTRVPIDDLWETVNVIGNWADLIPGYVAHEELSEDESIWTVKGDVGILARTVEFRARVVERQEPSLVAFSLDGVTEMLSGRGEFRARAIDAKGLSRNDLAVARKSLFRRWRDALVRRLWRRRFPAAVGAMNVPDTPDDRALTEFAFSLELVAGGVMAPVINKLIEPLLGPAAEDLASAIVARVETGSVH